MTADGYCQICGVELIADPEGDHRAGHTLCWACWRERNAPAPAPDLARRVAELEEALDDLDGRLGSIELDGWR